MISSQFLSALIVFPGSMFMIASLVKCMSLSRGVPDDLKVKWSVMTFLVLFFTAGYLGFISIQLLNLTFPLELLTAAVFLGGAAFVFLVMQLTATTIHEYRESMEHISEINERLSTRNKELGKEMAARRKAEKKAQIRLQHLGTLHTIDLMITSNLDLKMTMTIFLEQIVPQLKVDAAAVLLLNPYTQTLTYGAGIGFKTSLIQKSKARLGTGLAGVVAMERRMVRIDDLEDPELDFVPKSLVSVEKFRSYCAVPLIAKGEVKGVLEVYKREVISPDEENFDFMQALAAQAAIAIDNATLFNELQTSNTELVIAYDSTIEGWGKALNLRDRETEDHTQRVTELTVRIARIYGMHEKEIVHVRRGALLHDIGKMGVPDIILTKEGPLSPEEEEIMHNHPMYAFEILMPIAYLRPALDIPYCHHEKWDGTGYPRGLKGEQIPIAARIFTLVDTWDALISERRYHQAWPSERVTEYIRERAGTHFDPNLVELFLANVVLK
ncbi:MAG: HD domain-containing protein [Deltaproteobacteria bacterium]|jgi:HD-GYP domain-containing protein (c-di-GMP phosphodiesterase class II)|nr:HD domain-containing protein [Deltaproteobacteria bacterium]